MPLSESQVNRVVAHLRSKITNGCPMCGRRDWNVDKELHFSGVLDPEYRQPVQGAIVPLVLINCTNCYFSYYLPAMRLGLLD